MSAPRYENDEYAVVIHAAMALNNGEPIYAAALLDEIDNPLWVAVELLGYLIPAADPAGT